MLAALANSYRKTSEALQPSKLFFVYLFIDATTCGLVYEVWLFKSPIVSKFIDISDF